MFPRLHVIINPIDLGGSLYRVRIGKGWWAGPGTGGRRAELFETVLELKADSEAGRIREALRAAADAYEG